MPLFHVGGTSYMQYGLHNGVPSYMTRDVDGAALAGGILAGATRWQEKSGEGIALASAVQAADSILQAATIATTQGAAS